MKRGTALAIIICIVLIFPGIILGARDKPFYLFWDIPFGLKVEECQLRLKKERQLEFTKINGVDSDQMALISSRKQNIEYMEYPVDIALIFLSRIYSATSISFHNDLEYVSNLGVETTADQVEAHLQKSVDTYVDLLVKMKSQYGNLDSKLIVVTSGSTEELDFPMRGDRPDAEALRAMLDTEDNMILSVAFSNMALSVQKSTDEDSLKPACMIYLNYQGDA